MKIIQNTPEKIILRMEKNETMLNAIRRSLLEIPTIAIDDVEIFKNDSALYNEIIAHRLGLIPLKTEKAMSDKTKIDFKLTKKGPCTVYAEDLKGPGKLVHPRIPITILNENHKLELIATATLGLGVEHAKHIPGLCYYRPILEVKTGGRIDQIVEKSKTVIKPEKKGNKWLCDLKDAEVDEILKIDKNAISDSSEVIFVIESYEQMPAKDILNKAIKALEKNLSEFEKQIK